ncbi:DUF1826 domain-containing protein [Ferrovibrio sp.]|uniref:DUF1826 domain-containing protein n=1 Tax=Ferrovibrio sp. TaxID=1917215 RepID=UPI0035B14953
MSAQQPQHAAIGDDIAALALIARPALNIAIWRRSLPLCLRHFAQAMAEQAEQDVCFWLDAKQDAGQAAQHAFAAAGWPAGIGSQAMAADIAQLAKAMRKAGSGKRLHVDIGRVRNDACRYYHTDRLHLRLLCSYVGPGTEWIPDDAADRSMLGKGMNAAVLRDPARLQHLQTGWAALLKGDGDHGRRGIVHRSPPLQPGQRRLVLTIDEPGPHLPD